MANVPGRLEFSPEALQEKETLEAAIVELVNNTVDAFIDNDLKKAETVEPLREWISMMCNDIKMLTLDKFEEASEVVKNVILPTNLIYSEYYSAQTGGKIYLKPENMQFC